MAALTTKQKTLIVLQQDLGINPLPSPEKGATAKDLQKDIVALATRRTVAPPSTPRYPCISQKCLFQAKKPNDTHRIWLGMNNEIPRWTPGSVINWTTSNAGWPNPSQGYLVNRMVYDAALEWNGHNIGVTFRWVPRLEDCAFVVVYGGPKGTFYAESFFPNGNDLNYFNVYDKAFEATELPIMKDVFCHELGHILGLRHEFAATEPGSSVQFGTSNPISIMSYTNPPGGIQESDVNSTRVFYNSPVGYIGRYLIHDYVPDN